MVEEQRNANQTSQENHRSLRFSLRRVLLRFCDDANTMPSILSSRNLILPVDARPYRGGPFGDVYMVEVNPYGRVAFKMFRVYEAAEGTRTFSKASKIHSYHIDHAIQSR